MPLYEVKAMIDTLYFLTHPMRDLTAQYHRLPSYVTPSLCLEAKGESNGAELQLWTCDGDPLQHWVYYRASGYIYNPNIGKCLEISYGVHASGQTFPVSISECFEDESAERAGKVCDFASRMAAARASVPASGQNFPARASVPASDQNFPSECLADEWQRWTYDPETHVLLSAMGPVLTIGSKTRQSKDWLAELILDLLVPRAGDPVSSSPLLLSGNPPQIVFHAENPETVYPKQQWLADEAPKAPPVVCRPTIKQTTPLVGSSLPNC
jgi:hypothetical protein